MAERLCIKEKEKTSIPLRLRLTNCIGNDTLCKLNVIKTKQRLECPAPGKVAAGRIREPGVNPGRDRRCERRETSSYPTGDGKGTGDRYQA